MKGYQQVEFEGDSKRLINRKGRNFNVHNWILDIKTWEKRFVTIKYTWIYIEQNEAADIMSKMDFYGDSSFQFYLLRL